MKLKSLLRRALALGLTAAALAGPLAFPASRTAADTEFDVNGTAFTEPSYDSGILYYWHEGIPSVTKDKGGNYIQYPVIISWNDKYYLCTDAGFMSELNETHSLQSKENGNHTYIGRGSTWEYFGSDSFGYEDFDRVWGETDYYLRYLYDMSGSALLAKCGIDIDSLLTIGEAVGMKSPKGMPYLVCTDPGKEQYAIGLDEKVFGADYWLVGRTRTWERIHTSLVFGSDEEQYGEVQWGLDYEYWDHSQFLNKDYKHTATRAIYDVNAIQSYSYTEGADQHYWTVKRDAEGKYHFWTTGESNVSGMERISGAIGPDGNRNRTRDWFHANDIGRMSLYYSGSTFGVDAASIRTADWSKRQCTVSNTSGFRVYYGEPNIVSFHRQSFDVVSGQVVNLDGPRVIDSGCTVTVRDGGVLACNGWVINNGQILVEPGGMLILTERETATGDHQLGAITSVGAEAGSANGRIACDGTLIINRDCKLTCAGTYGLQLGESAQVVNYGQIITENLEVYSDHAIENRGDASAVFAGWGVTDSGYALTRTAITGQSYNGKGTREKAAAVRMPRDAVYGEGASRLYINSGSTVTYTVTEKKRGYASGFTAPIAASLTGQEEVPSTIPIYYDEEYETPFITVEGTVYAFDGFVGKWVNMQDGGNSIIYDYRMPSQAEEYLAGKLPEGYRLASGITVGEKVPDNLKFDYQKQLYWFGEDGVFYYYEEQLKDWIHVQDSTSYYRHSPAVSPPPSYASRERVPYSMLSNVPQGEERYYTDGMKEIGNPAGKPEGQT